MGYHSSYGVKHHPNYMQITMFPQNGYFTGARRFFADAVFPEGKEQRDRAERAANMDALTGLANRRAFDLAQPTAEADPDIAFILFDANNFGMVNKVLGFHVGDKIIQNMAQVLHLAASKYQMAARVFRLGGDEFVIMCPVEVARELRDLVESLYQPFMLPDLTTVGLSGTIGNTLADADSKLQARKVMHKAAGVAH
jgi:diguanylate cyclase (GGDEF)-like protein